MNMAGKRLLMLGGTVSTYDFVKMAQEMGVYTIVTDNNPEPGPAKQIADEIAMVSTDDMLWEDAIRGNVFLDHRRQVSREL